MSAPLGINGTATLAAPNSHRVDGIIGGGQIGYNWDFRPFLIGLEADIQASGQSGSGLFSAPIVSLVGPDATALSSSARLDWFGTVRGRAGLIAADRWLFYFTGGLAYGRVDLSGSAAIAPAVGFTNPTLVWNNGTTRVGWTIGVELKMRCLRIGLGNSNICTWILGPRPPQQRVGSEASASAHPTFVPKVPVRSLAR
jgi:outer membrane immunogenic protein